MPPQSTATLAPDVPHVPLTHRTKLLYGIGGVSNGLKNSLSALFTVFFYTSVQGLSGSLVGLAAFIGLLADLALDPLIGSVSDRVRSPHARPALMVGGSVAMGVSFWAMFAPPPNLDQAALFAWLLATTLVGRVGMAMFTIPYFAVGSELSTDYRERTAVSGVRGMLTLVSALVAASASFVLFFPNRTPGVDPKLTVEGYASMGLVFGALIALAGIMVLGARRRGEARAPASGHALDGAFSFTALAAMLRNPAFRLILGSFFLFFLGIVLNSALSIHYLTYYVGITSSAVLSSCQLGFYVGSLLGVALWLRLSRHADKHVLYGVAAAATALLLVAAFALVGEGRLLGTGNVSAMVAGHWVGGALSSIVWFMPQSMIADASDAQELATNQRQEGSFFALFYLGRQLAVGVSSLLAGVLLQWFAGFESGGVVPSADTISRIGLLFGACPAVLLAAAAALMMRYRLGERELAAIRVELDNRRTVNSQR